MIETPVGTRAESSFDVGSTINARYDVSLGLCSTTGSIAARADGSNRNLSSCRPWTLLLRGTHQRRQIGLVVADPWRSTIRRRPLRFSTICAAVALTQSLLADVWPPPRQSKTPISAQKQHLKPTLTRGPTRQSGTPCGTQA